MQTIAVILKPRHRPYSSGLKVREVNFAKALVFVILLIASTTVLAAQDRAIDVRFAAGSSETTICESLTGRGTVLLRVGAEAGQTMSVSMTSSNLQTYFNLYGPGRGLGDEALAVGQMTDPLNAWTGVLPTSGEYTIAVYLMRAAARRDETSDFAVDISVTGETGAIVQSDYADGLAGGPDFFAASIANGGTLNMRVGPSAGADVVARIANGQNVRNLGCRMAEGRRWCRVATLADPGVEGWAAGDFLIEGSGAAFQTAISPSSGNDEERIQFDAGTSGTELTASLVPGASRPYVISASDGQNLYVRVAPRGLAISYQIFNPDEPFLLDQVSSGQEYRGQLWQSGDHVVEVINRTNTDATSKLNIGID